MFRASDLIDLVVLVGLVGGLAACDPCFGVGSCNGEPRIAVEGTLVEHTTGSGTPGVRVDVIRTGGVELASDSLSTTTDAHGHWTMAVDAQTSGDVLIDIKVNPPGLPPYRVTGIQLSTTDRHGAGHILPAWVVNPHFAYAAELYYRRIEDVRIGGATVEFHRTGGIDYYVTTINQVYTGRTDASGRLVLFDIGAHAVGLGDLIGDLVVRLPAPFKPDTVHGLRLTATQLFQTPVMVLRMGAGPSLLYTAELRVRRTGKPAPGARVAFEKTGGGTTTPAEFSTTSDQNGRFLFPFQALDDGAITGDLTVTPPPPDHVFRISNVTLTPYHDDVLHFYGVFGVGPYLPWVGLVQIGGRGVQGVDADFHRTGGVAVQPADYTTRSDVNGYISLAPQPLDTGVVEADITIHSPAPFPAVKSHIRLHTVEDDTTGGVIMGWDLDAPHPATALPAPDYGVRALNALLGEPLFHSAAATRLPN
jgi:hypothetical protein